MPTRRHILIGALSAAAAAAAGRPAAAQARRPVGPAAAPAEAVDLAPGGAEPVTAAFQRALDRAAAAGRPLRLGPGTYTLARIRLPNGAAILGTPGATRLAAAAPGPILLAEGVERVRLADLTLDGGDGRFGDSHGLLDARGVGALAVRDCTFLDAPSNGVRLEASGGRIEGCRFAWAAEAGLFALDSTGLAIVGNTIADCGNGGVLVWRGRPGPDGTLVTGNRIERIRADGAGTGQNGNGVNVFRAGSVVVADNWIADAAFSAIRANSASDVQITGNQCRRSGETAIYAEFAFEGAVISANLVDGAANGISVTNFNEGGRLATVSANLVRNLSDRGPYPAEPPGFGTGIAVEADAAVTGNVVEGAPLVGLWIGYGRYQRDVVATGNVLRDVGTGIAVSVADGAGPALISGNLIRGARRGAIVGYRLAEPATGDLAAGADVPRHLAVAGNRVLP